MFIWHIMPHTILVRNATEIIWKLWIANPTLQAELFRSENEFRTTWALPIIMEVRSVLPQLCLYWFPKPAFRTLCFRSKNYGITRLTNPVARL